MNTARWTLGGSNSGTQTAALGFGGNTPPITAATESYNGTSWTTETSLSTARRLLAGTGVQTSALAAGGLTTGLSAATEEWTGPGVGTTKTVTVS